MRVTIEKLVYGGSGLARTPDGVVFVPRTAPGDVAEVEVVQRKPDYLVARMTSLVEPSPDRREPDCPNYASAGCCHWQHLQYARQLEIKDAILRETLRRTARIDWQEPLPVLHGPDRHYRLRSTFHVRGRRLGYVREKSHVVVPILECAALQSEINAFIPKANEFLASTDADLGEHAEMHTVCGPPVLASFGKARIGEGPARLSAGGCVFDLQPEAFFQSNRYLLEPFLNSVVEDSGYVLDLYCGSGFFTIPLARRVKQILGVESNRAAVQQARLNAQLNGVGNAEFHEVEVEAAVQGFSGTAPDLVVLNPPRTGCGTPAAERVAGLGASKIVYVSCNPATFARELPSFTARGYSLKKLVLVDQFPNTYHIELVATLLR